MHLSDSSNRVTYGTKISDRIWKDNNNQLICRDCIIARTGFYDYLESDVVEGGDPNRLLKFIVLQKRCLTLFQWRHLKINLFAMTTQM